MDNFSKDFPYKKSDDVEWKMEQSYTEGNFKTENESAEAFDSIVTETGLFVIHKEIVGQVIQPRLDTELKGVRVDRILGPKEKLLRAGWKHGFFAVEIKQSGKKAGPPLSQIMDYSRNAFYLPPYGCFMPKFVFLWPLGIQHGIASSIMMQNRVGSAWVREREYGQQLELFCGDGCVLIYGFDRDQIIIGKAAFGKRVGTR